MSGVEKHLYEIVLLRLIQTPKKGEISTLEAPGYKQQGAGGLGWGTVAI